jgi:putative toxin-antitoxin system antitoxin component (TIGR02293 family)
MAKDKKSSVKEYAQKEPAPSVVNEISISGMTYQRFNRSSRMNLIRERIPFDALEALVKRSGLSIKLFLQRLEMPQTTYNKKKRENALLDRRDSELVLILAEVLDYGLEVFNGEEDKFHRWLKKSNYSLGGVSPESLFDSITGIEEVKFALNRIEHGVFA